MIFFEFLAKQGIVLKIFIKLFLCNYIGSVYMFVANVVEIVEIVFSPVLPTDRDSFFVETFCKN